MKGLRLAGSFLTRVPLHADGEADVNDAVPWFPVVGALVGGVGAGVAAVAWLVLPAGPSVALALVAMALVTGAFHHDGVADIADAFGGGWNPDDRFRILKDSRHGTYGVTTLVLVLLVQYSAWSSTTYRWAVVAPVLAGMVGRAAILGVLLAGTPAHRPGLGTDYSAGVPRRRAAVSLGLACGAAVTVAGWWGVAALAAVIVTSAVVHRLAVRKIGGFTGDVLGATEIVAEAAVFLVAAAAAAGGASPWWW
ncbi:MAG: adenosylcobinamide-GDP ribazoletransferase [Ilumatobacteraceae bacterium]